MGPTRSLAPTGVEARRARALHRRAVLAAPMAALWSRAASAASAAGAVEALRGSAYAQAMDTRRTLALASEIFIADQVSTSTQSALGLRLGTATLVRLGPEARLRIDRYLVNAGGVLELGGGAMLFEHDAAAHGPELAIRTPFGLLAVRGTRFFAGPSNGVFGVFVIEGAVEVVGAGSSVRVTPGLGTDILRPGAEPTDPHGWSAARVERALASVS